MGSNSYPVATLLFMGERLPVHISNDSWEDIVLSNKKFFVKDSIAKDFAKLEAKFNEFCDKELSKIIKIQIAKLRNKKIKTEIQYQQDKKVFFKKVNVSINDFLKMLGYSQEIDFKIGKYDKEWGINEINVKAKKFVLFFNSNLIKYDKGPNIEYVVAHELAHIFHRDHGPKFQLALEKLYSNKKSSEFFFNIGIKKFFKKSPKENNKNLQTNFKLILLIFLFFTLYLTISFIFNYFNQTFFIPNQNNF